MSEAELESLAVELAWVRRLARAIARDSSLADDLAQDAMAVADEAPADHRAKWFGRVLRNLLRMRLRGAARRARYESVPEPGVVATPEELVARTEAQRAVSGAVLALAEPYRSTVVLRYVEDLSSAEIARRLGIPEGTVRRRLKVALDRLRTELDRDGDGSRRFALLALGRRRPHTAALTVAGAIGILALTAIVIRPHDAPARTAVALPASAGVVAPFAPPVPSPPALAASGQAALLQCQMLSGHVRDALGPIAGARVSAGAEVVTSDALGHYELCIHPVRAIVRIEAPGYGGIEDRRIHPTGDLEHDFELVPEAPIHGRVVDLAGQSLANVRVVARPDRSERAAAAGAATTGADGSFTLAGIAPGRFEVVASTADRLGRATVAASSPDRTVEIVVDQPAPVVEAATVTGHVTRHGRTVAGAEVWCLATTTVATTASDGSFVLAGVSPGHCGLVALTATAVSEIAMLDLAAGDHRQIDLDAANAGSISGTIVDQRVAPVGGVTVAAFAGDGTPAGDAISDARGRFAITTLPGGGYTLRAYPSPALDVPFAATPVRTALADGDAAVDGIELAIDDRRVEIRGRVVDEGGAPISDVYVEATQRDAGLLPPATRTSIDGSFAIRNLVAGSYVIRARSGDGRRLERDGVTAGRGDVVLVLAP